MNIQEISEQIEQGKAVLVLGPDIMFDDNKMLLKEFSNYLKTKGVEHKFNDDEELFSSGTRFKPPIFRHIPMFFEKLEVRDIHNKIAEIPFHLIISLSPDLLLKKSFEDKGFDHDFSFYQIATDKKEKPNIEKPTKEKPLLYNLLGIRTEYNSMVLCFNHLFDYLVSALGRNEFPEKLRSELNEAIIIFFLGFKYDKWYFKLILRMLNKDDDVTRQASFKEVENSEGIINFYTDEFNFVFIEKLTGSEIIDQIHDFFIKKNALRKPKTTIAPEPHSVTNIINLTGDRNIVSQNNKGDLTIQRNE